MWIVYLFWWREERPPKIEKKIKMYSEKKLKPPAEAKELCDFVAVFGFARKCLRFFGFQWFFLAVLRFLIDPNTLIITMKCFFLGLLKRTTVRTGISLTLHCMDQSNKSFNINPSGIWFFWKICGLNYRIQGLFSSCTKLGGSSSARQSIPTFFQSILAFFSRQNAGRTWKS